jgi:hypothetical protein
MSRDRPPASAGTRPVAAPAVALHIERVVLHGAALSAAQCAQLHSSLAQELTRLVREESTAWHTHAGMSTPRLNGRLREVSLSSSATQLGCEIARAVFASLGSAR